MWSPKFPFHGTIRSCDVFKPIRIHEVLGSGAFGTVYRGVWSRSKLGSDQVMEEEVAVKTMDDGACEGDRVKFLQEAAIMGQFDHPNIIKLIGVTLNVETEKVCHNYYSTHVIIVCNKWLLHSLKSASVSGWSDVM